MPANSETRAPTEETEVKPLQSESTVTDNWPSQELTSSQAADLNQLVSNPFRRMNKLPCCGLTKIWGIQVLKS